MKVIFTSHNGLLKSKIQEIPSYQRFWKMPVRKPVTAVMKVGNFETQGFITCDYVTFFMTGKMIGKAYEFSSDPQ